MLFSWCFSKVSGSLKYFCHHIFPHGSDDIVFKYNQGLKSISTQSLLRKNKWQTNRQTHRWLCGWGAGPACLLQCSPPSPPPPPTSALYEWTDPAEFNRGCGWCWPGERMCAWPRAASSVRTLPTACLRCPCGRWGRWTEDDEGRSWIWAGPAAATAAAATPTLDISVAAACCSHRSPPEAARLQYCFMKVNNSF